MKYYIGTMSLEEKLKGIDKYVNIWVHMRVSSKTITKLKKLGANPQTKTYDTVINELIDEYHSLKHECEKLRNQNDELQSALILQTKNGVNNGH